MRRDADITFERAAFLGDVPARNPFEVYQKRNLRRDGGDFFDGD